jgi:hypothetical protein
VNDFVVGYRQDKVFVEGIVMVSANNPADVGV